jgi:hypothetical protein
MELCLVMVFELTIFMQRAMLLLLGPLLQETQLGLGLLFMLVGFLKTF